MKRVALIVVMLLSLFIVNMNRVDALSITNNGGISVAAVDCTGVLGDVNDSDSFAYFLQQIFTIMKFAAPVLVLIFTVIDFVKAIASQDKESLKKAAGTSVKRLIIAILLFFVPTIINMLLELIGVYGTCGIG